jgi:RND family efflux transporter MFP subunit
MLIGKPKDAGATAEAAGPKPLQFVAAEIVAPQMNRLPELVEFSGSLVAVKSATVKTRAAATLLSLDVAEGQQVKAGQMIGRLDLTETAAKVDERNAGLESARASLANAQRQYDANRKLQEQNFIAPTALDGYLSQLETARAQVKAAEAGLVSARLSARDARLDAPIDGIVSKRHVVAGEKLGFEQPVVTIIDLRKLEVAGSVGIHEVGKLAVGQAVTVVVEGLSKPVSGKIARIAPMAEAGTRSISVFVAIDNVDQSLKVGQYANVKLMLDDPAERLVVPQAAVVTLSGQDYVWTIENGKLTRRIVTTGRKDPASGRIEVLTGLPPKSQLLAMRFDNLKEGAVVEVVAQRTAAPAAAKPDAKPEGKADVKEQAK